MEQPNNQTPLPSNEEMAQQIAQELAKKKALDVQIKKVFVCVTLPQVVDIPSIKDILSQEGVTFVGIVHDQDTYEEDTLASDGTTHKKGEPKAKHLHFYATDTSKNGKRKGTWLKLFARLFRIDEEDTEGIQVQRASHPNACVRYLLHLDSENKFQYEKSALFFNMTQNALDSLLLPLTDELDVETLLDVIKQTNGNKMKIAKAIGLKHFNQYLRSIDILIKCTKDEIKQDEIVANAINQSVYDCMREIAMAWVRDIKFKTFNNASQVFEKYGVPYKEWLGMSQADLEKIEWKETPRTKATDW